MIFDRNEKANAELYQLLPLLFRNSNNDSVKKKQLFWFTVYLSWRCVENATASNIYFSKFYITDSNLN